MPSCQKCGYAVLGNAARCAKCGAPLPTAPTAAPSEAALRVMRAPRAVIPHIGRIGWGLALLLLLCAGWYAWRVYEARASVPLHEGAGWTFVADGGPSRRYFLQVAASTTFAGQSAYEVVCQRSDGAAPIPLGSGFVARHLLGIELVGVGGGTATQELHARLLPFPYGPGSRWRSVVGRSWMESQWSASFQAARRRERVTVPAGTFNALRVDFQVGARGAAPVIRGSYWLAPGVGPVKFVIGAADNMFGIVPMTLRLTAYQ